MVVKDVQEYMIDWDWEANASHGINPKEITVGSRKRVFWKCHVCHGKWDTVMKERRGCPYCNGFKALAGYNDLATTDPELARQWSAEDNDNLTPEEVTRGSHKKVVWICDRGHKWEASIHSRTQGRGCPYCNNRNTLVGFNDLASTRPELAAEWNYGKNAGLTPQDVAYGTKKIVWWKCKLGHEWEASISNRCRGNGCPICSNRVIVPGYNDLATTNPELAAEWDYSKNTKVPTEYSAGARAEVWWICKRGHSWKTAIVYRSKGNNCPICAKERQVSFPEKAVFFYLKKVIEDMEANYRSEWTSSYELDMYSESLKVAVEYDGVYGHSTKTGVDRDNRKNKVCANNGVLLFRIREEKCPPTDDGAVDYLMDKGNGLEEAIPFVIKTLVDKDLLEKEDLNKVDVNIARDSGEIYSLIDYSEKENSLLIKETAIARMWNYEKNGKLTPEHVTYKSTKVVWWKGECGHEWRSNIAYEVSSGLCPFCSGKRVLKGFNDLKTLNPELANEWDYEKNKPLLPDAVTEGSGKKVWWLCDKNHSWKASIVSRKRGNGCPICANRIAQEGVNDVASSFLIKDWDYHKNHISPKEVTVGSEKKVWWICSECGTNWIAPISARYNGRGCPSCAEKTRRITAGNTYVKRSGSLQEKRKDLIEEWDWRKNNDINPDQVTCGSTKKVWWICKTCGHKWYASIASRCRKNGGRCPKCADISRAEKRQAKLLQIANPLSKTHPEIAKEWDYEKNGSLSPDMLTHGSGKSVWWKCSTCGKEWQAQICERTRARGKCPRCSGRIANNSF
jgi:hypothetical protein